MKNKFCYLVYCNADPIVYAVYSNKKAAVKYASLLIKYRENWAKDRGYIFDYYHFFFEDYEKRRKDNEFEVFQEKTIFSTCLKIVDKDGKATHDNECFVKVIRKPLLGGKMALLKRKFE